MSILSIIRLCSDTYNTKHGAGYAEDILRLTAPSSACPFSRPTWCGKVGILNPHFRLALLLPWTRVYSGAALATSVAAVEAQSNCHRETGRPKPPRLVGGTC